MSDSDDGGRRGAFRVGGVPVVLPWSSVLGVLLITWLFAPGFADPSIGEAATYLVAAVFALLVYASILLHELAHAWAARSFGYPVRRIELYALGGYTWYERKDPRPGRELVIALAGPAATFAVAAVCFGCWRVLVGVAPDATVVADVLRQLTWISLLVGVYNLLPGLPLDGGALVRSAVWKLTGSEAKGTVVGAYAGFAVAGVIFLLPFGLAALAGPPVTAPDTVAVVVASVFAAWLAVGANGALRRARLESRLPGITAGGLARRAVAVDRDTPLSEALRRAAAAGAGGLVVVDHDGRPAGLTHEAAVSAVPEQRRPWVPVSSVSRSLDPKAVVARSLAGEELLQALQDHPAPEYLVVDDSGRVYGVLALVDVEKALA